LKTYQKETQTKSRVKIIHIPYWDR